MKICIIGFSGSGKSTLAKRLAKFYNIAHLHLDSVHFLPNWIERNDDDMEKIVNDFMKENNSWIIDGNYRRIAKDRFNNADIIIFLYFISTKSFHYLILPISKIRIQVIISI